MKYRIKFFYLIGKNGKKLEKKREFSILTSKHQLFFY